jgi:TorA maturation chaperone TorD
MKSASTSSEPMKPVSLGGLDDHDEIARAEVYGLIAHLYHAPPGEALHARLRTAVTEAPVPGAFLEQAWGDVVAAAQRSDVEAIAAEYAALFLGVGKPEILPYGSFHQVGNLNGKPLVDLRSDLRALGLERPESITETEDHLASLCEVMRYLIAGDDIGVSNLGAQQRFFNAHLRSWVEPFCEQLAAHPRADFYRAVAMFSRDFFAVEAQGLDLLDA